jgi:hypothetical protein
VVVVTHVMNKFYRKYYDVTIRIIKTEEEHKDIVYKQSNVKDSCVDFGRLSLNSSLKREDNSTRYKTTYSDNYIPINEEQANYLQSLSMKKTPKYISSNRESVEEFTQVPLSTCL